MGWTTPTDIKAQLQRHWSKGRLLSARLRGDRLFPMTLRLARPDAKALSERFQEVRQWIRLLEEKSKAVCGAGYEIQWTEVNHRQLGRNRLPGAVVVPTEDDGLHLLAKRREAERFQELADATARICPALRHWLLKKPLKALEHARDWERILAVVAWFCDHPHRGLYLRQLEIPDVDTKFIEERKGLLSELLDQTLPQGALNGEAARPKDFEQRYGLLSKPPLIRFRLLDERLHIRGMSDVSTPAAQFARLALPANKVFVTENDINGLAFPNVPEGLVIFGLGYGLERVAGIEWLKDRALYYWGDIDTHGFAILDRLRRSFPEVRSFLMDRETLLAHRSFWVRERARYDRSVSRLTMLEEGLFEDLKHDRLGDRVRLEQERVSFGCLKQALQSLE